MSRLIDADAIPYTMLYKENWMKGTGVEKPGVWKDTIDAMPTIEERKTGEWIDEGFYADGHNAHAFRCSECGGHIIEYDADPFCRWCGADMRGEENATD